MLKKDTGICIRTTDYSETSQILTFFTKDSGKIGVIAKGARRPKSSFGGPIEICTAGEMVFSLRDGEKLGTLTEFNPVFIGTGIRKKLVCLNFAVFAAEMLNLFTKELDSHPAIFEEALLFLHRLDENPDDKVLPFLILFENSLLTETGSQPHGESCINCKRHFSPDWKHFYFSVSANGLVCRDCEAAFVDKKLISYNCACCLNQPTRILNAARPTLIEIEKILLEYITATLERPPRTADMILKLLK